jgi:hypothetical protein
MGCGDLPASGMRITGKRPPLTHLPAQVLSTLKVIVEDRYTALIERIRGFLSVKKITGKRRNEICH